MGGRSSKGFKSGFIVSSEDVACTILESVSQAESMAGVKAGPVCVNISGVHAKAINSRVDIKVSSSEILEKDISCAVDRAGRSVKSSDQQILHLLPQYFVTDENTEVKDPLGMCSKNLQANVHVVLARKSIINSLVKTLRHSSLVVSDIVLTPLASSYSGFRSCKSTGACQIDVGDSSTSLCFC